MQRITNATRITPTDPFPYRTEVIAKRTPVNEHKITNCQSPEEWSFDAGNGFDTDVYFSDSGSICLTCTEVVPPVAKLEGIDGRQMASFIEIPLYIPADFYEGTHYLQVKFIVDTNNYFYRNLTKPPFPDMWWRHNNQTSKDEFIAVGTPAWDDVTSVSMAVAPTTGMSAKIYVDRIITSDFPGGVIFNFDDNFPAALSLAAPILNKYGFAACTFVNTAWPGIAGSPFVPVCLSWEGLHELDSYGWDIGSHCHTHPRLPELTDEEALSELQNSTELLRQNGFDRGRKYMATPYGQYSVSIQNMASKIYRMMRLSSATVPRRLYPQRHNEYAYCETVFHSIDNPTLTFGDIAEWIDHAVANNYVLSMLTHNVAEVDGPATISATKYEQVAKYCYDNGIPVYTYTELFETTPRRHKTQVRLTGLPRVI